MFIKSIIVLIIFLLIEFVFMLIKYVFVFIVLLCLCLIGLDWFMLLLVLNTLLVIAWLVY